MTCQLHDNDMTITTTSTFQLEEHALHAAVPHFDLAADAVEALARGGRARGEAAMRSYLFSRPFVRRWRCLASVRSARDDARRVRERSARRRTLQPVAISWPFGETSMQSAKYV